MLQPARISVTSIYASSLSFRVDLELVLTRILSISDVSRLGIEIERIKFHHIGKIMLAQGEGSAHSSESESESMEVPGEGTPPSVESKEEKIEVPGDGNDKVPDDKSPEAEKEKPKPRASVLEYKSVSQMYVLRIPAMPPSHEVGCLRCR